MTLRVGRCRGLRGEVIENPGLTDRFRRNAHPGHSNADVGAIAAAVGDGVGVSVARGDARSSRVAVKAMEKAGWFAPPER